MITLVIGGARSGKSAVAERMATDAAGPDGPVTYVATIWPRPDDADLDARLALHRERRPSHWVTVEPPYELAAVLRDTEGVVLVDSLGSWLSAQPEMAPDTAVVLAALSARTGDTVIVTDEVGWGVHPETALGRQFRDAVGRLNQSVSGAADRVLLVVAGRVLRLEEP